MKSRYNFAKIYERIMDFYVGVMNGDLPEEYPRTNLKVYNDVLAIFERDKDLPPETIIRLFNLESRTEMDILNLKEVVTLVSMQSEEDEKKQEIKNELLPVLLCAIDCFLDAFSKQKKSR